MDIDLNEEEEDNSEKKKMYLLGGIVLAVGVIITVLIALFFTDGGDGDDEAVDTRESFELSDEEVETLRLNSNQVLSIVGNYGVLVEVDGDNYVDINAELFGAYNTDTANSNIRTRAGVIKLLEEGLLLSSSFDLDIEANSYNLASFTAKISASDISVDVPAKGYFNNGRSFVEISANFSSHQVIHIPEGENPDTGWQGIVNIFDKTVDEEVKMIFEKVSDGWLLVRIDGLDEIYSVGIVGDSSSDVNTIIVDSFVEAGSFDTGVRNEDDIHTHEHFDEIDPPSTEDLYSEEDLQRLIEDLRQRYTDSGVEFTEEMLRLEAEQFLIINGPGATLPVIDGETERESAQPETDDASPEQNVADETIGDPGTYTEDNYESRYGSGGEFTPDTNE